MATDTLRLLCRADATGHLLDEGTGAIPFWTKGNDLAIELGLANDLGDYLIDSDVSGTIIFAIYPDRHMGPWDAAPVLYAELLAADCNATYNGSAEWIAGTDELANLSFTAADIPGGAYRLDVRHAGTQYCNARVNVVDPTAVLNDNVLASFIEKTADNTFDTFAELDAIVADKSLVNLEDSQTWTGTPTFSAGATFSSGNIYLGSRTRLKSATTAGPTYTLGASEVILYCTATTAVTLSSNGNDNFYIVKNTSASDDVTIASGGGATIDGAASYVLGPKETVMLGDDGTNWQIL